MFSRAIAWPADFCKPTPAVPCFCIPLHLLFIDRCSAVDEYCVHFVPGSLLLIFPAQTGKTLQYHCVFSSLTLFFSHDLLFPLSWSSVTLNVTLDVLPSLLLEKALTSRRLTYKHWTPDLSKKVIHILERLTKTLEVLSSSKEQLKPSSCVLTMRN